MPTTCAHCMSCITTYHNRLSGIRPLDLFTVVHHIQGLIGHILSMNGASLGEPSNHHVGISYRLHLRRLWLALVVSTDAPLTEEHTDKYMDHKPEPLECYQQDALQQRDHLEGNIKVSFLKMECLDKYSNRCFLA